MAAFCIRPELAIKLKQAAKAGEITMQKLFDMSSQDRRDLFKKFVDEETARGVNKGFEKAMLTGQEESLKKWVNDTFTAAQKKTPGFKDITQKIEELKEKGLLTPESEKQFLEDVVSEKFGVKVTKAETDVIVKLSDKLQEKSAEKGSYKGYTFDTHSEAYYVAQKAMDDYIQSLTPMHNLRVFTSTIGRGAMLLTVKSPLLNIASNSIVGFMEVAGRRIAQRRFNGFNSDYAAAYREHAINIYKKSGYDLSRFQEFGEANKIHGEDLTHSQGKGPIRKIGRAVEDVAFKKMQGLPDVMFSAFHFTDSANLSSSVLALKEGLKGEAGKKRALEIMQDAFKEAPETKEGQFVRAQAEADALYATFTNKSYASNIALGFRELVNTATGDFRLGDFTDPFVKTPANVISAGLDYSGVTVTAKMATGIVKTLNDLAQKKEFDKTNFAGVNRYMIRAGLGLTFAYAISQLIDPQDFIGQYPTSPTEQKLLETQRGVANSIRVGDKWISLEYLSIFGAPLLGMLYAKKYGSGGALDAAYRYAKGVEATVQNLPGLDTVLQAGAYIMKPESKKTTPQEEATGLAQTVLGSLFSRIDPGIFSDIANMTDENKRQTDKNSLTDKILSQTVFRQGMPIKRDIFGDPIKTEPWLSTLLFGSRVKTANDSQLINELVRLNQEGELPSITDVSKNSKQMGQLKQQIGEGKFKEATQSFGQNLKQNMTDTIKTDEYKQADSPLAQKKMLDKVKLQTLKDTLDQYGYEKPEKE